MIRTFLDAQHSCNGLLEQEPHTHNAEDLYTAPRHVHHEGWEGRRGTGRKTGRKEGRKWSAFNRIRTGGIRDAPCIGTFFAGASASSQAFCCRSASRLAGLMRAVAFFDDDCKAGKGSASYREHLGR